MNFKDIPQFTKKGNYEPQISWDYLPHIIDRWLRQGLDLNPDFQRGHVWTVEKRIKWLEYKLSGGPGTDVIYFNCPGWGVDFKGPFVIVDGLQRLTSATLFLDNKIPVFGKYYREYEGTPGSACDLKFNVNNLETRAEVLRWYLQMNKGGTPHTKEELTRVKELLVKELYKPK